MNTKTQRVKAKCGKLMFEKNVCLGGNCPLKISNFVCQSPERELLIKWGIRKLFGVNLYKRERVLLNLTQLKTAKARALKSLTRKTLGLNRNTRQLLSLRNSQRISQMTLDM